MASHWYRIRLEGATPALEQERTLQQIREIMTGRAAVALERRRVGKAVRERPVRIYSRREDGVLVCYLDDGALALYRVTGGVRDPDAHFVNLPEGARFTRSLSGRYYDWE